MEEAGDEDICSLLNQLMGSRPHFGSGEDLRNYFEALTVLGTMDELMVREYRIEGARNEFGEALVGNATRPLSAFSFDRTEGIWRWVGTTRQMIQVAEK